MKVYAPATVTVSGLNATGWDMDLVCPAGRQITMDHINETTAGHDIIVNAAAAIRVDHIAETTGAHGIVHDNKINADHIAEVTGAHGVVFDTSPVCILAAPLKLIKADKKMQASATDKVVFANCRFDGGSAAGSYGIVLHWQVPYGMYGATGTARVKATLGASAGTGAVYRNGVWVEGMAANGARTVDVTAAQGDIIQIIADCAENVGQTFSAMSIAWDEVNV